MPVACAEGVFFRLAAIRANTPASGRHIREDETKSPEPIIGGYVRRDTIAYMRVRLRAYPRTVRGAGGGCSRMYPENSGEATRVNELSAIATKVLMDNGAFFSRPYGKSAGMIINRDAATVVALKKVKNILDPNNVMNPGKLCF